MILKLNRASSKQQAASEQAATLPQHSCATSGGTDTVTKGVHSRRKKLVEERGAGFGLGFQIAEERRRVLRIERSKRQYG
eukprot:3934476-Rhodomonas_salina.2